MQHSTVYSENSRGVGAVLNVGMKITINIYTAHFIEMERALRRNIIKGKDCNGKQI